MAAIYEIYLNDQDGNQLFLLDDFTALTWGRKVSDIGAFSIRFVGDAFDPSWYDLDRSLEIWRRPEGGRKYLAFTGWMRYFEQGIAGGERYVVIRGTDPNDLLRRRIIEGSAGSADANKGPGFAGDLIKAYVREALGNLAAGARDLTGEGFSVQADLGDGAANIEKEASRRNLLVTLKELAEASANAGTRLYFDISGRPDFQFRTFANHLGADRTYPSGHNPLIFSAEYGNLINPVFIQDWRKEWNYVYAAGQALEGKREVEARPDTVRIGASIFNRCELLFNGKSSQDTQALQHAGDTRLREGRPRRLFRAAIADTPGSRLGVDWNFGDLITAVYDGEQYDLDILAIAVAVKDGAETVTGRLEYTE